MQFKSLLKVVVSNGLAVVALAFLCTVLMQISTEPTVDSFFYIPALGLRKYFGNISLWIGLVAAVQCIVGSWYLTTWIVIPAVLSLGYINALKIINLNEPLVIFDLYKINQFSVLQHYLTTNIKIFFIVFILIFMWILKKRINIKSRNIYSVAFLISTIFWATFNFVAIASDSNTKLVKKYKDLLGFSYVNWNSLINKKTNGFLLAAVGDLPYLRVEVPKNYSLTNIQKSMSNWQIKNSKKQQKYKDIVVILSESFWDPVSANVPFNKDPIANIRNFMQKNQTQKYISPVFGGGTAVAEFEVLTGLSSDFMTPGAVAYQQYIKRTIPSIVQQFKNHGYKTLAFHNFYGNFWNRNQVYPLIGFDDYVSLEKLPETNWAFGFPPDDILYDAILNELKQPQTKPRFIFAVTVAAHGGYDFIDKKSNYEIEILNKSLREKNLGLLGYANKAYLADKDFGKFLMDLKKLEQQPEIVFFGDHQPSAAKQYSTESTGEVNDSKSHLVDVASTSTKLFSSPNLKSLSCLSYEILNMSEIELTPFYHFKSDICSQLPVLPQASTLPSHRDLYEQAKLLNYDRLFGNQYSVYKRIH